MKIAMTTEVLNNDKPAGIHRYVRNLSIAMEKHKGVDLTCIGGEKRSLVEAVLIPLELPGFDLVHVPTVTAPFFFRPGCKVVMTVHDLTPLICPQWHTWRSCLYFRHVLRRRVQHVDRFIAVSHCTKRDMVAWLDIPPDKIDVVHHGVSDDFKPAIHPRQDFILSVGTLEPRKNIARLVEAYAALRSKGKVSGKLIIAGKQGWGKRFQWPDGVEFWGYVDDKVMIRLYQTARMLVYPSLYEGFGLPILEAMACGCPVITGRVSALPEVGGDAVNYANPCDSGVMAHEIAKLDQAPTSRAAMSGSGLLRAARFSWERAARQTVAVYARTLAE